jgi:hypothetical protein
VKLTSRVSRLLKVERRTLQVGKLIQAKPGGLRSNVVTLF